MTYCTPYLLKLGLTKSRVSLIWIAGPLSGLIMQPVIGVVADRSTSPFGRRRPYMVLGTATVCVSLLLLGWTTEVVGMFASDVGSAKSFTVFLAVLSIYGIDFAINAVQASARSLIVDTLPSSKQQLGSAWGSRMVAIGHLSGYAVGAIDLTTIFGTSLGETQFKQLIIISMLTLVGSIGLTCWAVEERVLVSTGSDEEDIDIKKMMLSLIHRAMNLPPRIATICWIQFYCWIGWFPFLFYSSTWIGEVYMRFNAGDKQHHDTLAQIGRVGSTSLVAFSSVTLIASVVVPLLISNPEESTTYFTPRPPAAIADLLVEVQKYKPTMLTAWTYAHIVFAGTMVCTPFVTSLFSATVLIALCGM
jgi:solute carrier family 45 protein 1/2/4